MISGHLFTRDFLLEGIDREPAWQAIDEEKLSDFSEKISDLAGAMIASSRPNEAETESSFIYPVLDLLGWNDRLVQQTASVKGRKQVPDALLFPDSEARERAAAEPDEWKRYRFGKAILEAKRWNRLLDRASGIGNETKETVPSTQMLQYLSRIDITTSGAIRLGVLTNGCVWRLYNQNTLSVSEDYLEINLAKALALPGHPLDLFDSADTRLTRERTLKLFYLLFGKAAFLSEEGKPTLHEIARENARIWEEAVTDELSDLVFESLFPRLVTQLAEHDPGRVRPASTEYLQEVQSSALVLLYRLLFVVYAEDRDLLPDATEPYKSYSLTAMRLDIAQKKHGGEFFSSKQSTYWPKLKTIFGAIADGDNELGIPPYNGGLFAQKENGLLDRASLPDLVVAELIYDLSHRLENGEPRYINYRDLSVQHLGSIYERILDYRLIEDADGIAVDEDHAARHISGSYYTPDNLVMLIIDKAVGPLVEEKLDTFRTANESLRLDPRSDLEKIAELKKLDPAQSLLRLRICDPAMGSGHFLVSLVDWLADRVLAAIAEAEAIVDWSDEPYRSPLSRTIEDTRDAILEHAVENNWPYVKDQLDDRHIVRRAVLKRCVYGVDRNPMAVELAKVSLWLHTFTVGAPLSFLDHHLHCGNSLIGEWIHPAMEELAEWGSPLLIDEAKKYALTSAEQMRGIERLSDADIGQVLESKRLFADIELRTGPLLGMLDYVSGARHAGLKSKASKVALQHLTRGDFGDPVALIRGQIEIVVPKEKAETDLERQKREAVSGKKFDLRELAEEATNIISKIRVHLKTQSPFHWQVAFMGVWEEWESAARKGGFDAVIGNPPYVRQELIKEQKPALQLTYPTTYAGTADLYVYFYEQGLRLLRSGGRLSYVVTNKWLKTGYAKKLRKFLGKESLVRFLADFGHAKHFFPDADVFPSVLVSQKTEDVPSDFVSDICVIPRDDVPEKNLNEAVSNHLFQLPQSRLKTESWVLERPEALALLDKLRGAGNRLCELPGGAPLYGVKTGFNEAFLIDTETRERLIAEHASASEIIKPYVRGQDIGRWYAEDHGLWMIFARRGIDIEKYPSILRHLEGFRNSLEPKPDDWVSTQKQRDWPGRKAGSYEWYELQDAVDYYEQFSKPKILVKRIAFHPRFSFDTTGIYVNDSCLVIPSSDPWIISVLSSPIAWYFMFKTFPHKKDEALSLDIEFLEKFPIPPIARLNEEQTSAAYKAVAELRLLTQRLREHETAFGNWFKFAFDFAIPAASLEKLSRQNEIDAIATVLSCFPKRNQPGSTDLARIKKEMNDTIFRAHQDWLSIQSFERGLSNLVNNAYGLTEDDVALMWRTAPPRMPFREE